MNDLRIDRTKVVVAKLTDPDDMQAYWLSRPVTERLQAIELLRQTFYDYSEPAPGLQRVLEFAKLGGC